MFITWTYYFVYQCGRGGPHFAQYRCQSASRSWPAGRRLPTPASLQERKTFAMQKGLCFGCMEPGHRSKECKMRKSCKTCAKRHPSSLHGDIRRDAREMITTSRKSISTQTSICHCNSSNCCKKSSIIVPVWVSHSGRPDYERLVYALLDTQSGSLNDTCAALGVDGTPVQLSLLTMSASNQIIQSSRINGLYAHKS